MADYRKRPGVMIYFNAICPALARMNNEQKGALFQGIVDYAMTGVLPELDVISGMAFDMLRPSLDRDGERYERQVIHGQYMAYCRKVKECGEQPMSEDEYREQVLTDSNYQLSTVECQQPISTSTLTSTPDPIVDSSKRIDTISMVNTGAEGDRKVEGTGGTEGRGENISALSPMEISRRQGRLFAAMEQYQKRNGGFADDK